MDDQGKDFVITKNTMLEMLLLQHVTCHVVGPERQILASVMSCSGFVYEKKTLSAKSAS